MTTPDSPSPHMLREIFAQPEALRATFSHYATPEGFLSGPCDPIRRFLADSRGEIVIAASGSSRHAALVAESLIEDRSTLHVDVEYASEYPYRSPRAEKQAGVLVVSQSGETADTLASLRHALRNGHPTCAITNVPGSAMHREAAVQFPTFAGVERAIPATKSFTAQLLNMQLLALLAAEHTGTLTAQEISSALAGLAALPDLIAPALEPWNQAVAEVAAHLDPFHSFLFLGRAVHFPVAREGALKLKESAYLHAEGYPSGELKHGPNALVGSTHAAAAQDGRQTALVLLATEDPADPASVARYSKSLALLRDMHLQGATTLTLANAADPDLAALSTLTLSVPPTTEALLPLVEVIPLQLLAFHMSIRRGIDVDRPRNLTKAVLAE